VITPTPFAEFLRYHRVSVLFQSADEIAVILVDQCKPAVLEIRQIKEYEPSLQPRSSLEQATVVGDVEAFNRLLGGIVEQVELRSSLLLMSVFVLLR